MADKDEKGFSPTPTNAEEPEVGIVKDVSNADAALDFLRQQGEARPMTAEDEKRLVRKIDFMIMFVNSAAFRTTANSCLTPIGR